jgi:hypothetical protein
MLPRDVAVVRAVVVTELVLRGGGEAHAEKNGGPPRAAVAAVD